MGINKRRIPLQPRANLTFICPKAQATFNTEEDAAFKKRKKAYAKKYGQAALDEELGTRYDAK